MGRLLLYCSHLGICSGLGEARTHTMPGALEAENLHLALEEDPKRKAGVMLGTIKHTLLITSL